MKADTNTETEQTELTEAEAWVLAEVRSNTEPEPDGNYDANGNMFTGRRRVAGNTDKAGQPTRDEIHDAIASLKARGRLLDWHGLLAPADEDHLRALIENEKDSRLPRKFLIGHINTLLAGKVPDHYTEPDSNEEADS